MTDLDAVARANRRYLASQRKADADKEALFDTWAAAAAAGHSPEEISQNCAFSVAYVRRIVRERGVEPAARGRKPKA